MLSTRACAWRINISMCRDKWVCPRPSIPYWCIMGNRETTYRPLNALQTYIQHPIEIPMSFPSPVDYRSSSWSACALGMAQNQRGRSRDIQELRRDGSNVFLIIDSPRDNRGTTRGGLLTRKGFLVMCQHGEEERFCWKFPSGIYLAKRFGASRAFIYFEFTFDISVGTPKSFRFICSKMTRPII